MFLERAYIRIRAEDSESATLDDILKIFEKSGFNV